MYIFFKSEVCAKVGIRTRTQTAVKQRVRNTLTARETTLPEITREKPRSALVARTIRSDCALGQVRNGHHTHTQARHTDTPYAEIISISINCHHNRKKELKKIAHCKGAHEKCVGGIKMTRKKTKTIKIAHV